MSERYKLWRVDPKKIRYFVNRNIIFDETQIIIILCKKLKKIKEKDHIKIKPSNDELGYLEVLDDKIQ